MNGFKDLLANDIKKMLKGYKKNSELEIICKPPVIKDIDGQILQLNFVSNAKTNLLNHFGINTNITSEFTINVGYENGIRETFNVDKQELMIMKKTNVDVLNLQDYNIKINHKLEDYNYKGNYTTPLNVRIKDRTTYIFNTIKYWKIDITKVYSKKEYVSNIQALFENQNIKTDIQSEDYTIELEIEAKNEIDNNITKALDELFILLELLYNKKINPNTLIQQVITSFNNLVVNTKLTSNNYLLQWYNMFTFGYRHVINNNNINEQINFTQSSLLNNDSKINYMATIIPKGGKRGFLYCFNTTLYWIQLLQNTNQPINIETITTLLSDAMDTTILECIQVKDVYWINDVLYYKNVNTEKEIKSQRNIILDQIISSGLLNIKVEKYIYYNIDESNFYTITTNILTNKRNNMGIIFYSDTTRAQSNNLEWYYTERELYVNLMVVPTNDFNYYDLYIKDVLGNNLCIHNHIIFNQNLINNPKNINIISFMIYEFKVLLKNNNILFIVNKHIQETLFTSSQKGWDDIVTFIRNPIYEKTLLGIDDYIFQNYIHYIGDYYTNQELGTKYQKILTFYNITDYNNWYTFMNQINTDYYAIILYNNNNLNTQGVNIDGHNNVFLYNMPIGNIEYDYTFLKEKIKGTKYSIQDLGFMDKEYMLPPLIKNICSNNLKIIKIYTVNTISVNTISVNTISVNTISGNTIINTNVNTNVNNMGDVIIEPIIKKPDMYLTFINAPTYKSNIHITNKTYTNNSISNNIVIPPSHYTNNIYYKPYSQLPLNTTEIIHKQPIIKCNPLYGLSLLNVINLPINFYRMGIPNLVSINAFMYSVLFILNNDFRNSSVSIQTSVIYNIKTNLINIIKKNMDKNINGINYDLVINIIANNDKQIININKFIPIFIEFFNVNIIVINISNNTLNTKFYNPVLKNIIYVSTWDINYDSSYFEPIVQLLDNKEYVWIHDKFALD